MKNFLLEVLVQEMPYKFVESGLGQLKSAFEKLFLENGLNYKEIKGFAAPRRLAILVEGLDESQKDIVKDVKGPILKAAVDENGKYTMAALGFAKKNDVKEEELYQKDGYIFAKVQKKGRLTKNILEENIESMVLKLQGSHFMRWADFEEKFTRPIENVLAILEDETLDFKIIDKKATNKTRGHRFSKVKEVEIKNPLNYLEDLKSVNVYADIKERKDLIVKSANSLAAEHGLRINFEDLDDLLDEVTFITEFPVPVMCEFNEKYLEIPDIVSTTVMSKHQRYFPLYDVKTGKLSNKFITMANFVGKDEESFDNIKAGNQRVVSARLEDGIFFYNEDVKTPLVSKVEALKGMTFQRDLGTLFDKTQRMEKISEYLCKELKFDETLTSETLRAAKLSKADLSTKLVFEFTELQGFIGENYALKSGEKENVATAVKEHYFPLNANSELPNSKEGMIVSIADKIDTIAAVFLSTQKDKKKKRPTGSNDPLGVRRAAIGILRIIIESGFEIDIERLIDFTVRQIAEEFNLEVELTLKSELMDFIIDRLLVMLEADYDSEILESLRKTSPLCALKTFKEKCEDLKTQKDSKEFREFIEQAKRVSRITEGVDKALLDRNFGAGDLKSDEEKKLYEAVTASNFAGSTAVSAGRVKTVKDLYGLTALIDEFFKAVLVNDENVEDKNNRLSLLLKARNIFDTFADFTKFKKV